jgi:hypothetical protein
MATLLQKLSRKPKPKEKEVVGIQIAQVKEGVKVNVPIVEKIDVNLSRDEILKKLQSVLTVKLEDKTDEPIDERIDEVLKKSKLSAIEEGEEEEEGDEGKEDEGKTFEDDMEKSQREIVEMGDEEESKLDSVANPLKKLKGLKSLRGLKGRVKGSTTKSKPFKTKGFKIKGTVSGITPLQKKQPVLGEEISERELKKYEKKSVEHVSNPFFMNNRKKFISFINRVNDNYSDKLKEEAKNISCDRDSKKFSLMTHQMIVKDYINLYSPYRGLLIYHGLGAGKTCSSIAIAEGLKTSNSVLVMTPASLRDNYKSELKTCGDSLYKLNQFWEFIDTKGNEKIEEELARVLNLPIEVIK